MMALAGRTITGLAPLDTGTAARGALEIEAEDDAGFCTLEDADAADAGKTKTSPDDADTSTALAALAASVTSGGKV
jgi:hypothetical protein